MAAPSFFRMTNRSFTLVAAHSPVALRRVPGDVAMWFFIMAEFAVFALFFAAYAWFHRQQPAIFADGQARLDMPLALWNTAWLILGSAAAAWAAHVVRSPINRAGRAAMWALVAAWLCGLAFVVGKLADFAAKLGAGYSMSTDDYWMFYFSLTFFHFLHVILGMVILGMVGWRLRGVQAPSPEQASWVESAAAYWHMVDVVWLVLFALVYVAR